MTLLLDKNSQNSSLVSLQNKHFRTALDQLSNGVLLLDLHSPSQIEPKIVYVNDGLLELSGFELDDLIGEALSKIFGFRKLQILLDRLDVKLVEVVFVFALLGLKCLRCNRFSSI